MSKYDIPTDIELGSMIEQQVASSIGHWGAGWGISGTGLGSSATRQSLANQRAVALDYYDRKAFGNEIDGESQVISSDVLDTVEGILPSLVRIFTASDDAVQFQPQGPEDEDSAAQQTEIVNYVFYRQNNGYLILNQWFKDALIQNNGIVKYWWDEKETITTEEYEGLSEGQYLKFTHDEDYEILSMEEYEDETAKEQIEQQFQQMIGQIPPGPTQPLQIQLLAQQKPPVPKLYDIKIRCTKDSSQVRIECVPPEEFGVTPNHKSVSLQGCPFCYHKRPITKSELRQMGCPEDIIAEAGSGAADGQQINTSVEVLARARFIDQIVSVPPAPQTSQQEILVTDCYFMVDCNGDGIDELRHIIKVGTQIWINEEAEHINFACITPIIMPHTWVGMSVAELVMADQFTKSVILRQMLNNLYLTNNPRKAVLSSASGVVQANLDDLMNSRAGGIMREYVPNAIRNEETPFVASAAFPMIEYIDAAKEVRTGVTRYNQGTDSDSLNKTARGINMIQQAGQQRIDMIARNFAETGVKDLMRGIVYMLSRYSSKEMTVRLRNKWVEVDPRDWKTQFDMTVNVGLGTGNKDQQLVHLNAMAAQQMEMMKEGRGYMVSDQNIYNLYKKQAEAMGFKHPELFVSDPASIPPEAKQKPPPPELIKIQADSKEAQDKIASTEKIRGFDAETQKEIEAMKAHAQITMTQIQAQNQKEIEQMRMQHEAQLKVFETRQPDDGQKAVIAKMQEDYAAAMKQAEIASNERIAAREIEFETWKTEFVENTKKDIAKLSAKTTLKTAKMSAERPVGAPN